MKDSIHRHSSTQVFIKEIVLSFLAILSILLLIFEYVTSPSDSTMTAIMRFDFMVALIFLVDFLVQLLGSANKVHFIKHNWFLLLAAIPIVDSWAELLRAFRVFGLVRLVRAGEHLKYAASLSKGSDRR